MKLRLVIPKGRIFKEVARLLSDAELGSHDAGITGYDWICETEADVVEVLDLMLDPVKIVAAVPQALATDILEYEFKKVIL